MAAGQETGSPRQPPGNEAAPTAAPPRSPRTPSSDPSPHGSDPRTAAPHASETAADPPQQPPPRRGVASLPCIRPHHVGSHGLSIQVPATRRAQLGPESPAHDRICGLERQGEPGIHGIQPVEFELTSRSKPATIGLFFYWTGARPPDGGRAAEGPRIERTTPGSTSPASGNTAATARGLTGVTGPGGLASSGFLGATRTPSAPRRHDPPRTGIHHRLRPRQHRTRPAAATGPRRRGQVDARAGLIQIRG